MENNEGDRGAEEDTGCCGKAGAQREQPDNRGPRGTEGTPTSYISPLRRSKCK